MLLVCIPSPLVHPSSIPLLQEKGCEVEVRHPQIGTVMGWLPESEIKGPKALELAQEIEARRDQGARGGLRGARHSM